MLAEYRMSRYALTQTDIDAIIHVFRETLLDIPDGAFEDWLAQWTKDARLMPPGMAGFTATVVVGTRRAAPGAVRSPAGLRCSAPGAVRARQLPEDP